MDVEDIAPGADFTEAIEKTVGSCNVLIVVIGPRWVELLRSREGHQDFVIHEITAALRRSVLVIPALVGGAAMPSESQLPPELASLARRQAVQIRDAGFDQDATALVETILGTRGGGRRAKRLVRIVVAVALVGILIGSALFFARRTHNVPLNGVWVARMHPPGQRAYDIRLHLQRSGRTLTGSVEYPTGTGAIQEGTIEHGRVAFFTTHVPQFSTEPVKIMFSGTFDRQELALNLITPDGLETTGLARKR